MNDQRAVGWTYLAVSVGALVLSACAGYSGYGLKPGVATLPSAFVPKIAHALETKPRTPVIWLHGLECTCCSESFIRSAHPLTKDVVLSMLSLDYDDTLMAAAGHQAEAIIEEVKKKYKGNYIVAVEGNPPLNEDGMFCIQGGRPFIEKLRETCADAKAIISWGACASYGCEQAPSRIRPARRRCTR